LFQEKKLTIKERYTIFSKERNSKKKIKTLFFWNGKIIYL